MLALGLVIFVCVGCYCAGYATREYISRKRREKFLLYAPYVSAPPVRAGSRPPTFLIKSPLPAASISGQADPGYLDKVG